LQTQSPSAQSGIAMKIAIQTWGSTGDIRPMLGLASGLKRAGHEVELVVTSLDNRCYAKDSAQVDIGYRAIPAVVDMDLQAFAQRTFKMNSMQWLRALLEEGFFPYEQLLYETARDLAETHDLVIGHHFLYPLKLAARQACKLHVSVTLCHGAVASSSVPPFRFPNLGVALNRLQWQLFNGIFDWCLGDELGRLWRSHDFAIDRPVFDALLTSDTLDLVAVDPVFCPESSTWQPVHQCVGFLNLEDDTHGWTMPEAWSNFMNAGSSPVYFSFGSLQQAVPEWAMELFMETVNRVGCRAIVQTSSARYAEDTVQGDCLVVGRHPHQLVFERCAAVVHHGGAGTTHAATRAGCPSVVVPFMDEQLFWGKQLQRQGLADAPVPARHARPADIVRRLKRVLTRPEYRLRAMQCRQSMLQVDGVGRAVALIEERFGERPRRIASSV